jgi:hypothetical protein
MAFVPPPLLKRQTAVGGHVKTEPSLPSVLRDVCMAEKAG